ncbi:MAG TPA: DegT/DnrJ/EryC1/StrS family aminotransferase [Ktedonobacteraceae bacterium]|nr:DegT/DnrJ/EryC1/StrS family aminotransferase [Ktedonobacteraceae bacterium]
MIRIAQPFVGVEEEEASRRVLASGQLAQGPQVALFEQQFAQLCQVREAVAVSSGTSALQLALQAHGIGHSDEVITSAFSFAATANAILSVGATPVFVDIEIDTYTLDPMQVEAAITPHTRAIMPVHLYGHPCDMRLLLPIAEANALVIIEDACQAHGATIGGRPVGSFGTGCFSFYATKNITTGEGGMITTNDPAIADKARLLRNHGQQARYQHITLAYNMRMTELQGALGVVQLQKLEHVTQRRIANAAYLTEQLKGVVQMPIVRAGCRHVYHQYTIRLETNRDQVVAQLHARGIETAIHYPLPIYRQPFYQQSPSLFRIANYVEQQQPGSERVIPILPMTERAVRQVLSLPVHPALQEEELEMIAREVVALCR